MRAVILDHATLAPGDLALESLWALPLDWQVYEATEHLQTAARIRDADVVLTNKVVIDRDTMRECGRLKLIVIMATGTNNVDLDAARVRLALSDCSRDRLVVVATHDRDLAALAETVIDLGGARYTAEAST